MGTESNASSEIRRDIFQDNPHTDNKHQSNDTKPLKARSREKTAQRVNRKTIEHLFPFKYIENGLNGTKAYQSIRPHSPSESAKVEASRLLTKPNVQQALQELLQENKLSLGETMKIHRRNLLQDQNLNVSQTAVQDVYKLSGLLNNRDSNTQVNIAMVIRDKE